MIILVLRFLAHYFLITGMAISRCQYCQRSFSSDHQQRAHHCSRRISAVSKDRKRHNRKDTLHNQHKRSKGDGSEDHDEGFLDMSTVGEDQNQNHHHQQQQQQQHLDLALSSHENGSEDYNQELPGIGTVDEDQNQQQQKPVEKYAELQRARLEASQNATKQIFTPIMRDEMRLLQLAVDKNWSQDEYDEVVDWSANRLSTGGLSRFRTMRKNICAMYVDTSSSLEIEIAPLGKDIEVPDDDNEEQCQTSNQIQKRTIITNDILAVALELLEKYNPRLRRYQESEDMSELYHGEWWLETEKFYCSNPGTGELDPDKYLLPLLPFIDGVQASNKSQKSVTPVLLTLGLFSNKELEDDGYRAYVCTLPCKADSSCTERKINSDTELDFLHRSLEFVFRPVTQSAAAGGFHYEYQTRQVTLFPCVPLLGQDTDEGNQLAGVFNTWNVQQPCRICECSFSQCNNPLASFPTRKQDEQREIVERNIQILKDRVFGTVTAARSELKAHSLKPVLNAFWNIPVGTAEGGIMTAVWPELLHQFEGGLIAIFFLAFLLFFKAQHAEEKGVAQAVAKLDQRARLLSRMLSRQSDRSVPAKYFKKGISDVSFLNSQEFPDLLVLFMCLIGNQQNVIYNRSQERKWLQLSWKLLAVWSWLKKKSFNKTEIPFLEESIISMLKLFKELAGPWIPSGCSFPKFHLALHYPQFIRLFGPPAVGYGGYWERSLKHLVKLAYLRTSRHDDSAPDELRQRHRWLTSFRQRYEEMEEFEREYTGIDSDEEEPSAYSGVVLNGSYLLYDPLEECQRPGSIFSTLPEVCEYTKEVLKDIYSFEEPLEFRTEIRLCLNDEDDEESGTIFRATSLYRDKGPWFDFAMVKYPTGETKIVRIFAFIAAPYSEVNDVLMVCNVLDEFGLSSALPFMQYRATFIQGLDALSTKMQYKILPVSYITKAVFVSRDPDDTSNFMLLPGRDSWVECLKDNQVQNNAVLPTHYDYEVLKILKRRHLTNHMGRTYRIQYLAQWKNYHLCESSWVNRTDISDDLISSFENDEA